MDNHQYDLKTYNMSKLLVMGLSILLITGISLVPIIEIKVQAQVQQQQASPEAPPSPGGNPSSGTSPPPPASPEAPPSPGGNPSSGTSPPPPALDTADGGAVNQTTVVMIPQSSVMKMLDNLQTAMDAVADDEDAVMAIQSVDQELKSKANASGVSIESTTG